MKSNHKEILVRKQGIFFLGLLVALTVTFPFINLFHLLSPVTLFGKSAWIVLSTIIIGSLYIYLLASKRSRLSAADVILVAIVALCWLIFSVRKIVYNEQGSFLDIRFIATSLLYIIFARHLMKEPFTLHVMAYAIVMQGLLVAAVRSINFYFFPYIMVSYEGGEAFINTAGELTRDLLIGSSTSANHIVCGMFVLLVLKKHNILKFGLVAFIFIQFFMMLSTFNTSSRFPMSIAIGLFGISLFQAKLLSVRNLFNLTLAGVALFILISFFEIDYFDYFGRFNEDSGARYDKLRLTFQLILNSTTDFLIGSSSALVNSTMINGVLISDNSYGLIATTFGVPFALVYFMFLFNIFLKIRSDNLSLFFILYIVSGLGVTNSILWEPWVFTAFFGFIITSYYGDLLNNKKDSGCCVQHVASNYGQPGQLTIIHYP